VIVFIAVAGAAIGDVFYFLTGWRGNIHRLNDE
jgi:uncharacterized protein YkvS